MTRESEGERPQKTVAELLAEHGASVGGPRRRRRRAAEDDGPDIGDTAPQAIIERVRGDAPPPPEHRNGRNSRYLEVPAEYRNGHNRNADEPAAPSRPPQAPPRPPASAESTQFRQPAPPPRGQVGPQQGSGERRLPARQPQPPAPPRPPAPQPSAPQPSAPQAPAPQAPAQPPPAPTGSVSARLDGLDEASEQPPAVPPAPMGTGGYPMPPRGPRRRPRAAPPRQEPHTEQIPVVPVVDDAPVEDTSVPAPDDPPAGLARWRRRRQSVQMDDTEVGLMPAVAPERTPAAEDDLDGGPPTGTYTPTFDTGPQPSVPDDQVGGYDAGYDGGYGYDDFQYDGYERNGYQDAGFHGGDRDDRDDPDAGERGRRGELADPDADFDDEFDHAERDDVDRGELDGDDLDRDPDRDELDRDELDEDQLDELEASPAKQWLVLAGQLALGVAGGAGVWLGFSWLWGQLPAAALIAALLVVVALVWIVRKIRKAEDLQTTVLAVLVGLVVTVSPAALLLVAR